MNKIIHAEGSEEIAPNCINGYACISLIDKYGYLIFNQSASLDCFPIFCTVRELHNNAMLLLHQGIIYRHNGEDNTANKIYKEAFILESQAADLVSKKNNCEPTRSILYRSAAFLAYQANEFDHSLNLIDKCLSGSPNEKIKEEVRILYENLNKRGYYE